MHTAFNLPPALYLSTALAAPGGPGGAGREREIIRELGKPAPELMAAGRLHSYIKAYGATESARAAVDGAENYRLSPARSR